MSERLSPKEEHEAEVGKTLEFVAARLWEIATLLRVDAPAYLDIPGDGKSRKLAIALSKAFASYMSCVEDEQNWNSETFSGLAFNVEQALRQHGLKPPAAGDEMDVVFEPDPPCPPERRRILWTAKRECKHCYGTGLPLNGVCSCVSSL